MATLTSILQDSPVSLDQMYGKPQLISYSVMEDKDAQLARPKSGLLPQPVAFVRNVQSQMPGCMSRRCSSELQAELDTM